MTDRGTPGWKAEIGAEIASARRVVVLGVGNTDRGDDGAGLLVAASLARRRKRLGERPPRPGKPEVEVVLGERAPENATGRVRAFAPDLVIIVDAAADQNFPGTVRLVRTEEMAEEALATHRLPLSMLARYLEKTVPCRVVLIGLTPRDAAPQTKVSVPVRKSVRSLAKFLSEALFGRK
ncbi:MAG: hydrogenase maturation protease [Candidatus Aminicenantes bacterium]|nr:hydrogenase maturation protease [Candidatus Aminicenantes bacterium]